MALKTYFLTSPHFKEKGVGQLQRALKNNVFKTDFLPGDPDEVVDDDCGAMTIAGFVRGKYWAGYETKYILPTGGQKLYDFLKGKVKLPPDYLKRRNQRLKDAAKESIASKSLKIARSHLGKKESPANSNRIEFTKEWGYVGAWCNMFTSLNCMDAGSKVFKKPYEWMYVPSQLSAARNGAYNGLALAKIEAVVPGDLVCFDWTQNNEADHIGHFVSWIQKGSSFNTIEGNTSLGNDSNGGQVMERQRTIGQVAKISGLYGFIHVGK